MAGGNFYDPGPYYGFNNSNMEPLDEVCVWMHSSLIRENIVFLYLGDVVPSS
jgi:hypothetical protein